MQTVFDGKVTHQEYLALLETIHSTYFMLVKIASRRVDLFRLPWPYFPRSDVVRSHSAPAVRRYKGRV